MLRLQEKKKKIRTRLLAFQRTSTYRGPTLHDSGMVGGESDTILCNLDVDFSCEANAL